MINKKQFLGHAPIALGQRDAIHVAIVAVRAGKPIKPGQRCKMNEFGEAIPGDGPGVADPYRKSIITTGQPFWLLLNPTEVSSVSHTWEHPDIPFAEPVREAVRNKYIEQYASEYGVTYEQLMDACASVIATDESVTQPGDKTEDGLEEISENGCDDIWSEWSDETGHEFSNQGTECCPEYDYPESPLFVAKQT